MEGFSRRFRQGGVLIFMTIALALSAQATSFSNASLNGSYSFLTNLWTENVNTNEFAMIGVLTFNGAGDVTGSYTSISAGIVQTGTLGGTYSVNSNGTGEITFTAGSTAQFTITLNSTAAKVAHGVQLLQTNDSNNENVSGIALLQSTTAETYSAASLKGNLTFEFNHWSADPSQLAGASVGIFAFDGKGNVKITETEVYGGVAYTGIVTGTYTVNPDGIGTIIVGTGSPFNFALNSVAAGKAKGLQFIDTNPGDGNGNLIIAGTALKQ